MSYDGQDKTYFQETRDSMQMLGIVIIAFSILLLALWILLVVWWL